MLFETIISLVLIMLIGNFIISGFLCKEELMSINLDKVPYTIRIHYLSIEGLERCLSWMKIYFHKAVIAKSGECIIKFNRYNYIEIYGLNRDYKMQLPIIADRIKDRLILIYEYKKKEWVNNV